VGRQAKENCVIGDSHIINCLISSKRIAKDNRAKAYHVLRTDPRPSKNKRVVSALEEKINQLSKMVEESKAAADQAARFAQETAKEASAIKEKQMKFDALVAAGIIDENGNQLASAPSTQRVSNSENFVDCEEKNADHYMVSPTKGMNGGMNRMSLSQNPEEFD
jgi:hypothetical protein